MLRVKRFRERVQAAWPQLFDAHGLANYHEMLIELVDAHIERWDEEFAVHEENAEEEVKQEIDRLSVDRGKEGTLVRNYYQKCWRVFQRGIANFEKLTGRYTKRRSDGDWSNDPDLDWARKPFASGSERRAQLALRDVQLEEPAGMNAADALLPDGDKNLTNEPKVGEAVIIMEYRNPAEVTAKSDVDARPGSNSAFFG